MTAPRSIAVVICHGSYHSTALYVPFIRALQAEGFEAYCPQRPTCDLTKLNVGDINHPDIDREPPSAGYPTDTEDVETIIRLLDQLINKEGRQVLLVGHSSGGWIATQAAIPELQAKPRQAEGKPGGIIGLFYYGAFIIPVGESVHSYFQPKEGPVIHPPFTRFSKYGIAGIATIINAPHFLFNDLSPDDARMWETKLTASPIMDTKLTNDAYSVLPCAYLMLENDQMLPKEYQEQMVAQQEQKGGSFMVYRAPSGHSPHLSWTAGLVDKVTKFVDKVISL
ncbi:Alpha/beta hydrolase fold-1 [Aspergillus falconensis]